MFGIGGIEFVMIAIVAILVVGPKELPTALYNIGKVIGKFKEYSNSLTQGFDAIAREGELQDIVSKANTAGDEYTAFREEQQRAIEARRASGEDVSEYDFDTDSNDIDGASDSAVTLGVGQNINPEVQENKDDILNSHLEDKKHTGGSL